MVLAFSFYLLDFVSSKCGVNYFRDQESLGFEFHFSKTQSSFEFVALATADVLLLVIADGQILK